MVKEIHQKPTADSSQGLPDTRTLTNGWETLQELPLVELHGGGGGYKTQ